MPSLAQKKFIIPGITVLAIILLYASYCSSSADSAEGDTSDKTPEVISQTDELKSEQVVATEVVENTTAVDTQNTQGADEQTKAALDTSDIIFVEGKTRDYIVKFPDELSNEPMLVKFFSFWCPHCNDFEQTVRLWEAQKPDSVTLLKIPVVFGREDWRLAAKSYYMAIELELENEFSRLMYKTIHVDNIYPQNETDMGKIFAELGVSNVKLLEAAKSFNVDSNLRKAEYLTKKYKVAGVPYFLINFKYEAAQASYASQEALFKLWNYLPAIDFE